jgi:CheY-like chemotaxis protein
MQKREVRAIPKILLVEDDNISMLLLKNILKSEFCSIDVANNGEDGLRLLKNALDTDEPYDIVYADHHMPILTGGEMLKLYSSLEKEREDKKTKTVLISGYIDAEEYRNVSDYMARKPFRKKDIISTFVDAISA